MLGLRGCGVTRSSVQGGPPRSPEEGRAPAGLTEGAFHTGGEVGRDTPKRSRSWGMDAEVREAWGPRGAVGARVCNGAGVVWGRTRDLIHRPLRWGSWETCGGTSITWPPERGRLPWWEGLDSGGGCLGGGGPAPCAMGVPDGDWCVQGVTPLGWKGTQSTGTASALHGVGGRPSSGR